MKTDLYTKIVLTVIALALTVNVLKGFFSTPAQAAVTGNKRVVELPVNQDGMVNVNVMQISGIYVSQFNQGQIAFPVRVITP
jgi:hypothetical protein